MGDLIPLSSFCYCRWFGQVIIMEVINYDSISEKHQVKHLNAYGSFWTHLKIEYGIIYEI